MGVWGIPCRLKLKLYGWCDCLFLWRMDMLCLRCGKVEVNGETHFCDRCQRQRLAEAKRGDDGPELNDVYGDGNWMRGKDGIDIYLVSPENLDLFDGLVEDIGPMDREVSKRPIKTKGKRQGGQDSRRKGGGNMRSSSTALPTHCDVCGKKINGEVFQILGQTVRGDRNTSPHRPINFCKTCFNARLEKINKVRRRDKSHGDI